MGPVQFSDQSYNKNVFHLQSTQAHIWLTSVKELAPFISELSLLLSKEEAEKSQSFYFTRDKNRFIVAKSLLRCILAKYNGISIQDISYTHNQYNKPFLSAACNGRNIFFNISHSDDLILFALSKYPKTGIDIQRKNNKTDFLRIIENSFSGIEKKQLLSFPLSGQAELQKEEFFKYWVCKEAYVKAIGYGVSYPFQKFSVMPDENNEPTIQDENHEPDNLGWSVKMIPVGGDYKAALAIYGPCHQVFTYKIDQTNVGEIIKHNAGKLF